MNASPKAKPETPALNRRTALFSAGAVGAVAVAAAALPRAPQPAAAAAAAAAEPPADTSGYRLTEHVQRYYATARI
jgi:hypothetical protein